MEWIIRALVAMGMLLAVAGSPSSAALVSRDWLAPGDGLLTLDAGTNLQWLDVSQTALADYPGVLLEDRYQSVVAQTQSGGRFAGFAPASPAQALELAVNAGITLGTTDFATNSAPASALIDLIGFTQPANHGGLLLLGVLNEVGPGPLGPTRAMIQIYNLPGSSPSSAVAGAVLTQAFALVHRYPPGDGAMAVLLVREIPEPSTIFVVCLELVLLAAQGRQFRSLLYPHTLR